MQKALENISHKKSNVKIQTITIYHNMIYNYKLYPPINQKHSEAALLSRPSYYDLYIFQCIIQNPQKKKNPQKEKTEEKENND